jgi:hypothetical protein
VNAVTTSYGQPYRLASDVRSFFRLLAQHLAKSSIITITLVFSISE